MGVQAERDEKKVADVEKQAVLAAQAVALRRKLTESHLAKFRSEAKNRCVSPKCLLHCTCRQSEAQPNAAWACIRLGITAYIIMARTKLHASDW